MDPAACEEAACEGACLVVEAVGRRAEAARGDRGEGGPRGEGGLPHRGQQGELRGEGAADAGQGQVGAEEVRGPERVDPREDDS